MPRSLTAVLIFLSVAALPALDLGFVEPTWTLQGPPGSVVPGRYFQVTAVVDVPEGYYQDQESDFLTFEPAPNSGLEVLERSGSPAQFRGGKKSYTGRFTLTRTVVLPLGTPGGSQSFRWDLGWQICKVDGVCLLPARSSASVVVQVDPPAGAQDGSVWSFLAAAFAGGLVLNLMPCVFPVLALKGLGLAGAVGQSRRRRRTEAFAFAAGTVVALTALGFVTAAAAWGGHRLDWGFAFQSPLFVWALAILFWFLCLQLWGLWTWTWSPFSLTTRCGGPAGAFLGGAVLVLTAAPCTAPFLGPALGFAFALPPWWMIPFFFAAGLGLALPLFLLSLVPGLSRLLPKAGPWMLWVERAAGLVLTLTVGYLIWVLGHMTTPDRMVWAAATLVMVPGLLLVARRTPGRGHRWTLAMVVVLVGSFALVQPPVGSAKPEVPEGWAPYSPAALDRALADGSPVLVDGTAAWCATCQVNEVAVLDRADVRALLKAKGVVALRADYTRPDPEVQRWLVSVGRAGLPVYALYRPGTPVYVFPELLTDTNFVSVIAGLSP